jgi:hypothetical protein
MSKKNKDQVLHVSTHLHIHRDLHEMREGPVTIEEQIKALTRSITWHQRQLRVEEVILNKLLEEKALADQFEGLQPAALPEGTV